MCDYCKKVLGELTIPHKPIECQYRRSMYCYNCCSKGHCPRDCPNKIALAIRNGDDPTGIKNFEMIVQDTDFGVRFVLKQCGVEPTSTQQGNRNLLYDLANSLTPPRSIVFIKPSK